MALSPLIFEAKTDWVNVDPNAVPGDARMIKAEDLIRYETMLDALADRVNTLSEPTVNVRGAGWVYISAYLATDRVEGTTDDKPAFDAAFATGKRVFCEPGTYWVSDSPVWSDNVYFQGSGLYNTTIKLLPTAVGNACVMAPSKLTGTVQGVIQDVTLDGFASRQGGVSFSGGSRGSCLVLRNCSYFYVDRVRGLNPVNHSFDITRGALEYPYGGDGVVATLRSSNCYFNQLQGTGFGDDGFTVHSSDYIHVSNSIFWDPRKRDNCNGIEFDGDSRFCTSTNNRTFGCYAGIEVKGHGNESAAQHIVINGHIDTNSVRSYNFRHIGFHTDAEGFSKSALNIIASNLVSITPNNDKGFQDEAAPRALVISAFVGVSINGLTSYGRGGQTSDDYAIAIQFKSSHINLNNVNISGWSGAERDIAVTSGNYVNISNVLIKNSSKRGIYTSKGIRGLNIANIIASAPAVGGMYGLDIWDAETANITNVVAEGYLAPIRAGGQNYASMDMFRRRIRSAPANTLMRDLDPSHDYYISASAFPAQGTDRPAGATGGYLVEHSSMGPGVFFEQTITRNTSNTPVKYFRIIYPNILNVTDTTNGPPGPPSKWQLIASTPTEYATA